MGSQAPRDEGDSVGGRGSQAEGLGELTGSVVPGQEQFQWGRGSGGPSCRDPGSRGCLFFRLRSSALHHPGRFVVPTTWSHQAASALHAKSNLRVVLWSSVSEPLVIKTQPL